MTDEEVEVVAREISDWVDRALETHGRFDSVELARAAITALDAYREEKA